MQTIEHKHKWLKYLIIALVVILAAVGGFFGGKTLYQSGFTDGQQRFHDDSAENIKALGSAIEEKTRLIDKLSKLMQDISAEIDSEGISAYINNLEQLIAETDNSEVKQALDEYKNKWQEFKAIYDAKDNAKVAEGFEQLRKASSDTAMKIQDILDRQIEEKAAALNS